MLFLIVVFSLLTSFPKDSLPSNSEIEALPPSVNKTVLLRLVNEARKKGCSCGDAYYGPASPLLWNNQLETAALSHSKDMWQKKYFSHTEPDGSGAGERLKNAGYNWRIYGENIAEGYLSEQEVIAGWLHSPGHCRNIMNREFKEMGIAKVGNYWTQELAGR